MGRQVELYRAIYKDEYDKKNMEIVKENDKIMVKKFGKKYIELTKRIEEVKELLLKIKREREKVILVHDKDADGQSSGGIMKYLLEELGIEHETWASNRFDFEDIIEEHGKDNYFILTDLGSGQTEMMKNAGIPLEKTVILDHHLKLNNTFARYEVNPNLFGFSGSREISGAGLSYLVARRFGHVILSQIAIVGATGDMQGTFYGLNGLNRLLVMDGVKGKYVRVRIGLPVFGRETRPLFKSLQLMSEPKLFYEKKHVYGFLFKDVVMEYEDTIKPLNYIDFNEEILQKRLYRKFITMSPIFIRPFASIYITGENYELLSFPKLTPLRDAKEFSTLLNAMNRQNMVNKIGIKLTSFEHEKVLQNALSIQRKVRRKLAMSINEIISELDFRKRNMKFLVVLDETGIVEPHSTGTILQMLIDYLTPLYNKPLMGFTYSEDGIKISLRESKLLYLHGLDMAIAVEKVAKKHGGQGGGHPVACGAQVPSDRIEQFIRDLNKELYKQGLEKKIIYNISVKT